MPVVTVVVPTYNRLPLLETAISSVLAQTYQDFELIIVDDGSGDRTGEYVRDINDRRVRYLRLLHSGNIARVRNAGARLARGEWLAFLDADDVWSADKLGTQLPATSTRWSYTRYEHIDVAGQPVPFQAGSWREIHGWAAEALLTNSACIALCTTIMKRALFEAVGAFDEDPRLIYREDYHLLVRLALAAPVVGVPQLLAGIRVHQARSTAALNRATSFARSAYVYHKLLPLLSTPTARTIARQRRRSEVLRAGKWALLDSLSCS